MGPCNNDTNRRDPAYSSSSVKRMLAFDHDISVQTISDSVYTGIKIKHVLHVVLETVRYHILYSLKEDSLTSFGSLTYKQDVSKLSSVTESLECSTLASAVTDFRFLNTTG